MTENNDNSTPEVVSPSPNTEGDSPTPPPEAPNPSTPTSAPIPIPNTDDLQPKEADTVATSVDIASTAPPAPQAIRPDAGLMPPSSVPPVAPDPRDGGQNLGDALLNLEPTPRALPAGVKVFETPKENFRQPPKAAIVPVAGLVLARAAGVTLPARLDLPATKFSLSPFSLPREWANSFIDAFPGRMLADFSREKAFAKAHASLTAAVMEMNANMTPENIMAAATQRQVLTFAANEASLLLTLYGASRQVPVNQTPLGALRPLPSAYGDYHDATLLHRVYANMCPTGLWGDANRNEIIQNLKVGMRTAPNLSLPKWEDQVGWSVFKLALEPYMLLDALRLFGLRNEHFEGRKDHAMMRQLLGAAHVISLLDMSPRVFGLMAEMKVVRAVIAHFRKYAPTDEHTEKLFKKIELVYTEVDARLSSLYQKFGGFPSYFTLFEPQSESVAYGDGKIDTLLIPDELWETTLPEFPNSSGSTNTMSFSPVATEIRLRRAAESMWARAKNLSARCTNLLMSRVYDTEEQPAFSVFGMAFSGTPAADRFTFDPVPGEFTDLTRPVSTEVNVFQSYPVKAQKAGRLPFFVTLKEQGTEVTEVEPSSRYLRPKMADWTHVDSEARLAPVTTPGEYLSNAYVLFGGVADAVEPFDNDAIELASTTWARPKNAFSRVHTFVRPSEVVVASLNTKDWEDHLIMVFGASLNRVVNSGIFDHLLEWTGPALKIVSDPEWWTQQKNWSSIFGIKPEVLALTVAADAVYATFAEALAANFMYAANSRTSLMKAGSLAWSKKIIISTPYWRPECAAVLRAPFELGGGLVLDAEHVSYAPIGASTYLMKALIRPQATTHHKV